jgi:hypothetical protein
MIDEMEVINCELIEVASRNLPGETEENGEKSHIFGVPREI